MKMWDGRFSKALDSRVNDFNSSISFDSRMYHEDIEGSTAHAIMLAKCSIITADEAELICSSLSAIEADIGSGALKIDPEAEDIHMFIEGELTKRIGTPGKKLHTARSRNDQVALDTRMYLMRENGEISVLVCRLTESVISLAEHNTDTVMPGYTHLQRAQPITFAHQLMAYAQMLLRDLDRLADCRKRTNILPLGSCALATTTYPIDRAFTAAELGFDGVCENSIDGVSDRDFVIELASVLSLIMMHLSRFSEEIILWSSSEFAFIELDDAYSTGSSIMPQKKNPDITELVRGKTGRVYGDLMTLLTMMKGLPLAYNKDMQEDKTAVFDAIDTVKICLETFIPMLDTLTVRDDNMLSAVYGGFVTATDFADYLVSKGLAFRDAYKVVGKIVGYCSAKKLTFDDVPLDTYRLLISEAGFEPCIGDDLFDAIDPVNCVRRRCVYGGPAPKAVAVQIANAKEKLKQYN